MTNTFTLHYNYNLDSNNPTYLGERDFLLKVGENDKLLFTPTNAKYLSISTDTANRPVIGYGYDLVANRNTAIADLEGVGVVLTQAQIDAINALTGSTTGIPAALAGLQLPSEAAATTLLDNVADAKESLLDTFLAKYGIDWISSAGGSQEYAVLLSMWYQSPGGDGKHNGYFMNADGTLTNMSKELQQGNREQKVPESISF